MGVYIPNMSKPKDSCWNCKAQYNSVCSLKREHIRFDGILDDCPLIQIDLVRCGECKWSYIDEKYGGTMWCRVHFHDYRVNSDGFCNYGERRTDDRGRTD